MNRKVVKLGNYFKLPNPGLKTYLLKTKRGNDEEYRTPFFKDKSLSDVLQGWLVHLAPLKSEWPGLHQFELDLAEKVGPLSIQKPLDERFKDIEAYYKGILLPSKPISETAIRSVLTEWNRARGLSVRSVSKTWDNMKKSTSSGSPFFTKRKAVGKYTMYMEPCFDKRTQEVHFKNSNRWDPIAVLGWRGQEGGPDFEDVKQRVVWMFPASVNLQELRVYQPLIETAQRFNLVPAWVGMDSVDLHITRMFDTKGEDDVVICTDFSKFDQHFNADMARGASEILDGLFNGSRDFVQWMWDIYHIKYTIPLLDSEDHAWFGRHGMGSGSGGTNADETLAHRALQYEAALSQNQTLNPYSQCLGDDGVLTYPGIKVDDVMRSYTAHGQEMNESKQYVSKHECIYLRRWHHINYRVDDVCVGVYATTRALGRLCEQERYFDPEIWSKEMVALRQLSILENVKYHPLKEEFVKYCMKGDKYRLGLDLPGFLENIDGLAKQATDLMPDFLGYVKSQQKSVGGISEWWIVKYLRSLK
nr:MAG: RNA-dependent RNA polymerase [Human picobirnavirus]